MTGVQTCALPICFRPDAEAGVALRASLGLGESPTVIFIGAFYIWHDVSTLLKAFVRVRQSHPTARLLLVGDGEHRPSAARLAAALGIGDAVRFTGSVAHADVPKVLAAADIAVAPYPQMRQDMWFSPLKVFEFMASGKALVASSVGQIVDLIQHGRNGLLVPPGDAESLASALDTLIENTSLRLQLGKQAREDAVRKHSWEHYLDHLESILCKAVDERSSRSV